MEMIKIQMQISKAKNPSTLAIIQSLGLKGLYKGTITTLARDVPFSLIFFPSFSIFKSFGTSDSESTPFRIVFISGIVAGVLLLG